MGKSLEVFLSEYLIAVESLVLTSTPPYNSKKRMKEWIRKNHLKNKAVRDEYLGEIGDIIREPDVDDDEETIRRVQELIEQLHKKCASKINQMVEITNSYGRVDQLVAMNWVEKFKNEIFEIYGEISGIYHTLGDS